MVRITIIGMKKSFPLFWRAIETSIFGIPAATTI